MQNGFWISAFDGKMGSTNETLLQYSNSFWLKNDNSQNNEKSVVICLHGWTATTYESKPIGDAIFQSGIDSAGPLLPGHGFKENKGGFSQGNRQVRCCRSKELPQTDGYFLRANDGKSLHGWSN